MLNCPYLFQRFIKSLCALHILFVFIFLESISITAQEPQADTRQLNIGVKTEREVVGQKIHIYSIELKRGQVLRAEFIEKGVDVVAFAFSSDERRMSFLARSGNGFMRESLTMIANKDGVYGIFIRGQQIKKVGAKYEFVALLKNVADSNDRQRIQAEKLMEEANQIYANNEETKFPLAISKLEEALKIRVALGDKYQQAIVKTSLGTVYGRSKNFSKAEANFNGALNLLSTIDNKSEVANVYVGLGTIYALQKDTKKANSYISKTIQISKDIGDVRTEQLVGSLNISLLGDAEVLSNDDRLPDYEKQLAEARAKNDKATEAAVWAKSVLLYAIEGSSNNRLKLFERAEREGLPLARQTKDKNAEIQLLIGLGLGFSELENGFTNKRNQKIYKEKSVNYLLQGLILAKKWRNQVFESMAYSGLSNLYDEDIQKLSLFFGKIFINSIQDFRRTLKVADKESQQFLAKQLESVYGTMAWLLIQDNRLAEALQVINFGRDQEFFDFKLIDNRPQANLVFTLRETENARLFDKFVNTAVAKYTSNKTYVLPKFESNKISGDLESNFNVKSSPKDKVENVPDLKEMQSSLNTLSTKTNKKHVTIYYSPSEDGDVELMLITPSKIMAFLGDESDKEVIELLKDLKTPEYDPRPVASEIYKHIFKSTKYNENDKSITLETVLENYGADVIHWSLTGKIRYIPIAVLYDEETGQYLVEKFENVVFSRAKKNRFLSEPKVWKNGVGFGTSKGYGKLSPLPGVIPEVRSIFGNSSVGKKGYFNGKVFLNNSFTRQTLFNLPVTRPDFVHIASHFVFAPGNANNSYLLLGDGNKLSLRDMQNINNLFSAVDLLVLSACETAAQKSNAEGKEIDGLAELAQRLGAKSVIATLWSVDDDGTSNLMTEFYRIRKENPDVSKAEVLRLAQLKLLNGNSSWKEASIRRNSRGVGVRVSSNSGKTKRERVRFKASTQARFEHPYYWAPFVYYGSSNGKKTSNYILSKPKTKPRVNNIGGSNNQNVTNSKSSIAGVWKGKYVCGQGVTGVTLKITQIGKVIQGMFEFYPLAENSTFRAGSGVYKGEFNSTSGYMFMNGERWVNKPDPNWSLVGFSGSFDVNRKVYTGRMLNSKCGGIELRRQNSNQLGSSTFSSPNVGNNPSNENVTLNQIQSSFKNSHYDETIRLSNLFLKKSPNSIEVNTILGLSYLIKKESDNAVYHLKESIKLGGAVPIPVKRLREPLLGHGLDDAMLYISKSGINIISGNKSFQASYSDLTRRELFNYDNQCNTVHLKGVFTETRTNSSKTKQGKKTFNLFPPTAVLQPRQQDNLILNFAACSSEQSYISLVLITLINQFASESR